MRGGNNVFAVKVHNCGLPIVLTSLGIITGGRARPTEPSAPSNSRCIVHGQTLGIGTARFSFCVSSGLEPCARRVVLALWDIWVGRVASLVPDLGTDRNEYRY